jgi:2-alkenal reductase
MKKLFAGIIFLSLFLAALGCQVSVNSTELPIGPALKTLMPGNAAATAAPEAAATEASPAEAGTGEIAPTVQVGSGPLRSTDLNSTQDILVELYKKVSPGVVSIETISTQGNGAGSGFVFNKDGFIVTNFHVVQDATDIVVNFQSGLKVRGKVKATDLDSDIAVLKVDVKPEELTPLVMGDSDQLQVGQMVAAIGNPYRLSSTMTLGIISAKGRVLDSLRTTSTGQSFSAGDLIQTDASINPGNSGGPLLNLNGEVVGINRAIRTNGTTPTGEPVSTGIGFAVSVNIVRRVVPELIRSGRYDYPYLGLTALPEMTLFAEEALGLSHSTGAYVLEVVPGGPVDKAGLLAGSKPTDIQGLNSGGDLIIAADGRPVQVYADLVGYLFTNKKPGDMVSLTVLRAGKEAKVDVTLGKRP